MNIRDLSKEFLKHPWFTETRDYVELRYDALVNRMKKTFDYVTPHKENCETYSYEYASILRDAGSVFDSTIRRIIKEAELGYEENILGMLKFLKRYESQLEYVRLRFLHYGGFLYPFKPNKNGVPSWWNAYNKIKHEEVVHISEGNFRNALSGLSALGILKLSMGRSGDLDIFTIVDYPFSEPQTIYHTEFFDYIQFYPK